MKKIPILLSLIFLPILGFAQVNATRKANQLFNSFQYVNAIDAYLAIINKNEADQQVYKNLADSYYQIFNTTEAIKWYKKALDQSADAETYYRYAQSLKSLEKYEEANVQMANFIRLAPNDTRATSHQGNPNYLTTLNNSKPTFLVTSVSLLGDEKRNEFGPYLGNDNTLYFVSTGKSSKTDLWTNQPYLDIFKAYRDSDGLFTQVEAVTELNTPFHDGPITLSQDGNTMYFARDGHSSKLFEKDKENKVKIGQLGIYKAVKRKEKWEVVDALPMNNTSYSVSHPSLSPDGKTLYFSSNMPGGQGGSDIWKVEITKNGYGKPINLGNKINTPGREAFPFITADNLLYFASDGHPGYGGLDVFKVDLLNTNRVNNLGKPINTEKDDFSFTFNTTLDLGYFASNRSGLDVIYQATPTCTAHLLVTVSDKISKNAIANAKVNLLNSENIIVESKITNASGEIALEIDCDSVYSLEVIAANYEESSYLVEKTKEKQLTVSMTLNPNDVIITENEVVLGDVYFEFDKSNITFSGAEALNKLVKIMQDYPSLIIFVKSHTDSKGNSQYNLKLSEQRAQATVQYLISKGIPKDRISGKGFGSSAPKLNCAPECTEEQEALNRRSEFIILKK